MKKLIAIALAAMLAPAWGAEVVSSNIVGYEKINLASGYNMIGVQFMQVGGESLDLASVGTIAAATAGDTMSGFDEDGTYATTMRVWNGNGYDVYGWSGDSGTEFLEDSSLDNKWLNRDYEEVDESTPAASGFWINAEKAGSITISGEVPSDASVSVNLASGYNIVANPYPGAVAISEFGQLASSFAGFDEDGTYATTMRVWNGNGYDVYGWSGSSGTDYLEDSSLDNKWLNRDYEIPEGSIPFGNAVWINASAAGTITFTSPVGE